MYARANEQEEREAMAEHDFDSPRSTNRLTAKQQGLLFLNTVARDCVCAVCAYTCYEGFLDSLPSSIHFKTSNHADLPSASQQLACLRLSKAQAMAIASDCRCEITQTTESTEPGECHLLNFGISARS